MKKVCILLSTLLLLTPKTAFANSAQTYFQGITPSGAVVTGEQSPIIVQQENLTFDLQEFPKEYYREEAEYLAYTGKVTAEYTFHNPADYDVTAKLAFPFGQTPDYGYSYHPDTEQRVYAADAEKYDILVDGEPIEKTVRHTLFYRGDEFNLEEDVSLLMDGYMEDDFWKPDTPVTKETWIIDGIDEEKFQAARLGFRWNGDENKTRLMLVDQCGGSNAEEGIAVTRWVENGDTIEVYVFGEPLKGELEWFSENGAEDTPFDYELTFVGEETTTFEEFVFGEYEDNSTVLPHDWYNATVQNLKNCQWDFGILGNFEYSENIAEDLLRWYEYEITIPAGGTIVNTVTAPMYPDMDVDYEPPIYQYTYLLSPAKTWADFWYLNVFVNTPYYMTESSGDFPFQKAENEYYLAYHGLPEGELTFTLSEDASPKAPNHFSDTVRMAALICSGLAMIIGITAIVRAVKKENKS